MMASEVVAGHLSFLELRSFIRGYMYTKMCGNLKLQLEREPTNIKVPIAVAVMLRPTVVGHMSNNIAPMVSHFLKRSVNRGTVEVAGAAANQGGKYGLKIPCQYRFYGTKTYIDKL